MASPPHPRWADLPDDLLNDIAHRLPCPADRVPMSRVCRSWRKATHPPQPHLPWLLLPYSSTWSLPPDGVRTAAFFCVLGGHTHHLRVRHDTGGARFFGSYDGGWLFLAHGQTRGHALVNLHTGERILLPDSVSLEGENLPMVILAATLSSPPPPLRTEQCIAATLSSPPVPTEQCIAAAIVDTGCSLPSFRPPKFAFWRVERAGDQVQVASGFMLPISAPSSQLVDVIHHRGAFHFLTQRGDVMVCIPESQEGGLVVHEKRLLFLPPQYAFHHPVYARYLVESRGELLMVVRRWCTPPLATSAFRVFQMTQQQLPDGVVQHTWTELPTLHGRMLFVARGCSRSYEVADFPGFEDSVYFLDDRNSDDVPLMLIQNHLYRRYSCSANGRWSEGPPPSVQRWFPDQAPSNYSSPVWFLP